MGLSPSKKSQKITNHPEEIGSKTKVNSLPSQSLCTAEQNNKTLRLNLPNASTKDIQQTSRLSSFPEEAVLELRQIVFPNVLRTIPFNTFSGT